MNDKRLEEDGAGTLPDLGLRRRVFSLPTLAATALAVAVLVLAVWRVFDIDWGEMGRNVTSANPLHYVLAIVAYYLSFLVRGLRWNLIARTARLDARQGVRIPGVVTSSGIILMGWFANSVAFLRLGDAYRGWAFARESGATFPGSLGTVLAERVQDMAAVLLLVLAAAGWIAASGDVEIPGAVVIASVAMVVFLGGLMVAMRLFGLRLAARLPGRLQGAYSRFHVGTLGSFQPRDLPLQMALGVLGWLLEIARFYLVTRGLDIELNFAVVMFAALANAMLTTIPTPGGLGFVEGGVTGLLILLGMDDTSAFTLTIVDRSISWLSVVVFGGALFFAWQWFRERRRIAPAGAGSGPEAGASTRPGNRDRP